MINTPTAAPMIEDFNLIVHSTSQIKIQYTDNGKDFEHILDADINYEPSEPMTRDYPGWAATAELETVFGLTVAERHAFDKWMFENDIEQDLINAFEPIDNML